MIFFFLIPLFLYYFYFLTQKCAQQNRIYSTKSFSYLHLQKLVSYKAIILAFVNNELCEKETKPKRNVLKRMLASVVSTLEGI